VCLRRRDNSYTICSGQGLNLKNDSGSINSELILALRVDARLRAADNDGRIFLACPVRSEWLAAESLPALKSSREIFFSEADQKIKARERIWYDRLLLQDQETALRREDEPVISSILFKAACKNPSKALAMDLPANRDFINRVKLLKKSCFGRDYPDIDENWLAETVRQAAHGCRSFADMQKQSVSQLYFQGLSWQMRENFDRLVPERFNVPSGSSVKIDYQQDGPPILAVKIQELFGMSQTPALCNGTMPMLVHLLSPAGRPVQITSDLASFWKSGYHSVISELKGRYPKHPWPSDPANATAFHGTKKQLERKLKG
jgi:ATP-dependent helicase HrpB